MRYTSGASSTVGIGTGLDPAADRHDDEANLDIGCVACFVTRNEFAGRDRTNTRDDLDGTGAKGVIAVHDCEKALVAGELVLSEANCWGGEDVPPCDCQSLHVLET